MKLAIVDFDGTLLPYNTIPFLLGFWKKRGLDPGRRRRTLFKIFPYYLLFLMPGLAKSLKEKARTGSFHVFNGILDGLSQQAVLSFMEAAGREIRNNLRPSLVRELEGLKGEGYQIILLSGAYQLLLSEASKGTPIDQVWGSTISFEDGFYRAKGGLTMIEGKNKRALVEKRLSPSGADWADMVAYGDSITDLALLEAVGRPVMVQPDKALLRLGKERNWELIEK